MSLPMHSSESWTHDPNSKLRRRRPRSYRRLFFLAALLLVVALLAWTGPSLRGPSGLQAPPLPPAPRTAKGVLDAFVSSHRPVGLPSSGALDTVSRGTFADGIRGLGSRPPSQGKLAKGRRGNMTVLGSDPSFPLSLAFLARSLGQQRPRPPSCRWCQLKAKKS